jgi:glycosyltransferase involved in cell wall biosynthesis
MLLVDNSVAVVVPALNESESIEGVVNQIKRHALPIVVDDGSTDGTGAIARAAGAQVVTHLANLGYERALCSGISIAEKLGYRFVITFDADGQHQERTLVDFINHLKMGFDIVVGRRDQMQRFGEVVYSLVSRCFWKIRDPLCGIKGFSIEAVAGVNERYPFDSIGSKYTIDPIRRGLKFVEVAVETRMRLGQARIGPNFTVNLKILSVILKVLLVR